MLTFPLGNPPKRLLDFFSLKKKVVKSMVKNGLKWLKMHLNTTYYYFFFEKKSVENDPVRTPPPSVEVSTLF